MTDHTFQALDRAFRKSRTATISTPSESAVMEALAEKDAAHKARTRDQMLADLKAIQEELKKAPPPVALHVHERTDVLEHMKRAASVTGFRAELPVQRVSDFMGVPVIRDALIPVDVAAIWEDDLLRQVIPLTREALDDANRYLQIVRLMGKLHPALLAETAADEMRDQ